VLLTSEDRPEQPGTRREVGIAAVARKPIQQQELLQTIGRVLSCPVDAADLPHADPAADGQERQGRRLRVLVAEDNELNQQVVLHLLESQGHDVRIARDGRETLAILEREPYDLLLLDVHMPELDGFQVIAILRQREAGSGRHLPVIALTARTMTGDRDRCLTAGMDDYLSKPLRRQELYAVIERVLSRTNQQAEPGNHVDANGRKQGSLLDAAMLLEACDADDELLNRMIAVFHANASAQLQQVITALQQRDAGAAREATHRWRGLVSAFSTVMAKSSAHLEQAAAAGRLAEATEILPTLVGMLAELAPKLAGLTVDKLRSGLPTVV
jgi:CheY-like chemotaxis protein